MMEWKINFPSEESAQRTLKESGFSLGQIQRDDPRGIMFGEIYITKWRNLRAADRDALHGVYQRAHRGGPVEITLRSGGAPGEALRKLEDAAAQAAQSN